MPTKILTTTFVKSAPNLSLCPDGDRAEFVFIGRSNVGKSSLINALCDKKRLAKTSAQPGKTQLINYFAIETSANQDAEEDIVLLQNSTNDVQSIGDARRYLVDLPGYGYAKVSKNEREKWEKMINEYFTKRGEITQVFILIDSRLTPQKLDIAFVEKLHYMKKTFSLVFTKTDKISQKEVSTHVAMFLKAIKPILGYTPTYYTTTAEKRQSTHKLLHAIHDMASVSKPQLL